jgi:hypothetical protein
MLWTCLHHDSEQMFYCQEGSCHFKVTNVGKSNERRGSPGPGAREKEEKYLYDTAVQANPLYGRATLFLRLPVVYPSFAR